MIAEHYNNSFVPQCPPQCGQCILKTRMALGGIPRHNRDTVFPIPISDIPCPHHRIQPQTYHCRTLGTLAFPRLRLLAAQKLLGIFERILDAPATGKTTNDFGRRQLQICCKEKIVLLFAQRVAAYYQQYRSMRNLVPDYHPCVYQPLPGLASFLSFYTLPGFHPRSYLSRGWWSAPQKLYQL